MTRLAKRIAQALGLQRSVVGVLLMAVLVGSGEQLAERFLPLYLIALGSGLAWPGLLQSLHTLVGALYSFPGGWLAERIGHKRSLLVFNVVAIAGYALAAAVPDWRAVVVGSLLFLSWSAVSLPATMGLIASSLPKGKHVVGVSMHSLLRRVPKAVGPLIGGVFVDLWGPVDGVRAAFVLAIVMALLGLVVQQLLIEDDVPKAAVAPGSANPLLLFRSFSPALKNLFVADVLIRFCEQIPYAYVTIWCMEVVAGHHTARIGGAEYGMLTALEMATAVLCYVPVARWADRSGKKPFVLVTFVNFTLFPAVLFFADTLPLLVLAFVVRGLKEFGEPTRKALILQLAPAERQTAAFGAYYLFRDSIIALAAGLGAWLWTIDPAANLWAAFGFGVVGSVWFAVCGKGHDGGDPAR